MIRPARPQDAEAIARIQRQSVEAMDSSHQRRDPPATGRHGGA